MTREERIAQAIAECTECNRQGFYKCPDCDGCTSAVDEEIAREKREEMERLRSVNADLLVALAECRDYLGEPSNPGYPSVQASVVNALIRNVRAAIAKAEPKADQPALFELIDDRRPPGERTPAERYAAPSLFSWSERT